MTTHPFAAGSTVSPSPPATVVPGPGTGEVGGTAGLVVVGAALVWVVLYAISLLVNPYAKCRACKGRGKRFGGMFTYAFRLCPDCKGTGRQLRLGRRVFFGKP